MKLMPVMTYDIPECSLIVKTFFCISNIRDFLSVCYFFVFFAFFWIKLTYISLSTTKHDILNDKKATFTTFHSFQGNFHNNLTKDNEDIGSGQLLR